MMFEDLISFQGDAVTLMRPPAISMLGRNLLAFIAHGSHRGRNPSETRFWHAAAHPKNSLGINALAKMCIRRVLR